MSTPFRFAVLAIWLVACGPSQSMTDPDGGVGGEDGAPPSCTSGDTRCFGQEYQVCSGGEFVVEETCGAEQLCRRDIGCEDCGEDGCGGDCNATGAGLVYVVDTDDQLWSFDPEIVIDAPGSNPFALIGTLECDAGWPIDGSSGDAHPFSMSVGRNGQAWVLYNSGEMFTVDIETASCTEIAFDGTSTFDLFGMGFASASDDPSNELLYIASARGSVSKLGRIDLDTMQVSEIGRLPDGESSPELTGSGAGTLFGYYPGRFDTWVAELDKSTAAGRDSWELDPLGGVNMLRAWAFAHWGGRFYVFISWIDPFDRVRSDVVELDPTTGQRISVVDFQDLDLDHIVVGAGVSTCAPIVVP